MDLDAERRKRSPPARRRGRGNRWWCFSGESRDRAYCVCVRRSVRICSKCRPWCPPRILCFSASKTWMAGTSPARRIAKLEDAEVLAQIDILALELVGGGDHGDAAGIEDHD